MGGSPATNEVNNLDPQLQQLITGWLTGGGPADTALMGEAGSDYAGSQAPVTQAAAGLENFQALSPADIAALSTAGGAAVESAGRTASATSGGVPNQALQDKNLSIAAGQQVGTTATQLGEVAANQNLSAKEAGAGLLAGLSQEDLSALLGSLGIGESTLNTGVSGTLGGAQIQQSATNSKNEAIGSAFGGIGSLAGSLIGIPGLGGGGGGGGGGAPGGESANAATGYSPA